MRKLQTAKSKAASILILFMFVAPPLPLVLTSCSDSDDSGASGESGDGQQTAALYSAMIGTWVNENSDKLPDDVITITADSIGYSIFHNNNNTDNYTTSALFTYKHDVSELSTLAGMKSMLNGDSEDVGPAHFDTDGDGNMEIISNREDYLIQLEGSDFADSDVCFYSAEKIPYNDGYHAYVNHAIVLSLESSSMLAVIKLEQEGCNTNSINVARKNTYTRKSSGGSGGASSSVTDITGTYTIGGAKEGSSITFSSDGTWKFSYSSQTDSGTYSLSDGSLTVNFSEGVTGVFDVSESDGTYTLTGSSGDYTTIISSVFHDTTALQSGTVTLTKTA